MSDRPPGCADGEGLFDEPTLAPTRRMSRLDWLGMLALIVLAGVGLATLGALAAEAVGL